ncbi:tryptophan 2,3-dioxygenase family protein [Marivirga arenosa]|uniref:Tryptophan 2,3-dioxygenase family protein n=1 Tax=Marivirga arenosa TaxID=3059076 RepID=A0AA51ZV66_9BACT|nr:tryptophan 2,3-dioxygenase family protein [Marivirga sp. BKB1-2]WNB17342.1 tryptophan 2,3-dioxygenase family protein [Marivirga sp. BKB1-2]
MEKKQISESLEKLNLKYQSMGQDLSAYLDGLLLSNYTTYWDYINVDTLLTLQTPKTDFPDEEIFIIYHQITELYFKMCLNEMEQIAHNGKEIGENGEDLGWRSELDVNFFIQRLNRMNRYFETLTKSFEIMVQGMEKEQFQRFRMALLPASGFQSAQYRLIEFASTPLIKLVRKEKKQECENSSIEEQYEFVYWKQGATEVETGEKTLTLKQFEKKYKNEFISWIKRFENINIYKKYLSLSTEDQNKPELKEALRNFDLNVNVFWPLVHYKSAVRYLQQKNKDVPATGGTNWQEYLPPRFQKRIFFPTLWTEKEIEEWGKGWVVKEIFGEE